MKELVIDRTRWYRGKEACTSRLLRPQDNTMCCLGFYSLACGLIEPEIYNKYFPSDCDFVPEMAWLHQPPPEDADPDCADDAERVIGRINDDVGMSDAVREQKLTDIFAEHGVAVTFIN